VCDTKYVLLIYFSFLVDLYGLVSNVHSLVKTVVKRYSDVSKLCYTIFQELCDGGRILEDSVGQNVKTRFTKNADFS